MRPYLAQDLQFHERVGWNPDYSLSAGLRIGSRTNPTRSTRFELSWRTGHSPFGQFYMTRAHSLAAAIILEL
jgi:hypothetical protein